MLKCKFKYTKDQTEKREGREEGKRERERKEEKEGRGKEEREREEEGKRKRRERRHTSKLRRDRILNEMSLNVGLSCKVNK